MTKDADVSRRDREWNLGESGVERINIYDCIFLVVKSKRTKQTIDLNVRVDGPDADVISVLVCDARPFDVKFDMDTIAVSTKLKEFASNLDRGGIRVLGVVDAFGLR